jgi:hypothetical protein
MKHSLSLLFAALVALPVLLLSKPSHAQGWRCMDDPNQPACEEALINSIEDTTVRNTPNPLTIAMPDLIFTCQEIERCPHCFAPTSSFAPYPNNIHWSITWWGGIRSFLLGRDTANADLAGTLQANNTGTSSVPSFDAAINYTFGVGASEVGSPSGPTGVADLGGVNFSTASGSLWGATMPVFVRDGNATSCWMGVAANGTKGRAVAGGFMFDYPISAVPVSAVLAEAIRNQFRTAVRIEVTGAP